MRLRALAAIIAATIATTSCFTGIEGTKKIELTRDDRKLTEPSQEELFIGEVTATPLPLWKTGHLFVATDNNAALIFNQKGLPADPNSLALQGKMLIYEGLSTTSRPDGSQATEIIFSTDGKQLRYELPRRVNPDSLLSSELPMLVDTEILQKADSLLKGRKVWTRTSLCYTPEGDRVSRMKYSPVTILGVKPGNRNFPLRVEYKEEDGRHYTALMSFDRSAADSRPFGTLFSLDDPRLSYPDIEDDVWQAIRNARVKQGMTKDQCRLSLGNPKEVRARHDYSSTIDIWIYPDGKMLQFEDGLLKYYK